MLERLKKLREAKQRLIRATTTLEADTNIPTKICCLNISELNSKNSNFDLCKEILQMRSAILARTGDVGPRAATVANSPRAAGQVSVAGARILQGVALGGDSVSAYNQVYNSCLSATPMSTIAKSGACVGTPKVENLAQESCLLDAGLTAVGFSAALGSVVLNKAGKTRLNVNPEESSLAKESSVEKSAEFLIIFAVLGRYEAMDLNQMLLRV